MLKLWGRSSSSNVQKVRWLCAELNIPYQQTEIGGPFGGNNEATYRALNPNGLVPTIEDDDFVLWESNAILRYLCNKHQARGNQLAIQRAGELYPTEMRRRADVDRWLDWGNTTMGPALLAAFWGLIRTPKDQRDTAAIAASAKKTAECLAIIEQRLEGHDFICGKQLTLGDIPIAIHTYRWMNLPFENVDYQRPELPRVKAWYKRLTVRDPYRLSVMLPIV